jgi:hypothetical protein
MMTPRRKEGGLLARQVAKGWIVPEIETSKSRD